MGCLKKTFRGWMFSFSVFVDGVRLPCCFDLMVLVLDSVGDLFVYDFQH